MKRNKLLALSLTALMAISALSGCGGNGAEAPAPSEVAPSEAAPSAEAPADKAPETPSDAIDEVQYFNDYLNSEPATLDPGKAADEYANGILNNIMEKLTVYQVNADGEAEISPAGAESWDISPDNTVYTFKLRENYWQDGQKVTAQDYEYGIKRSIDPATGSPNSYLLTPIKNAEAVMAGEMGVDELGVKAIDENTLEITLGAPTPYFLSLTYQNNMSPVRKDVIEAQGDKFGSEADTILSNGPFVLSGWTHNSELNLVRNDKFWNKDNIKLEKVNIKILDDDNARHNSFDNGSIDAVATTIEEWVDRFDKKDGTYRIDYTLTSNYYSFFNTQDELFKNANIRKAFIVALDRDMFNEVLFSGYSEPAYGWVPKGVAVDATEYRSVAEEPLKKLIEENPDPKALLLKGMEELGLGDDPSTLKVVWSLGGTSQRMRTMGEFFQQILKQNLGVNLEIELNDWPMFQSKIVSGDFQIGYMSWGAEYNDPYSMLSLLISTSNAINTGWVNEEYDKLMAQASVEMYDAKRIELYQEAENLMLYEEGVVNPVIYPKRISYAYDYVKNMADRPLLTQGYRNLYTQGRP
ncbi:MAG: peptide ABC transporter substrate-binding protein [Lachnospiraceae bacterium]|jgi:oligopeptide transport system substrate-binding protein|nr:peptide ABC transporter substrate-binding protein [Lachnospiraceae bacterium]